MQNDFCLAPWTHTYISPQGERRLCCASREPAQNFKQYIDTDANGMGTGEFRGTTLEEHWNSEHVRNIRKTWLQGEVPDACQVCDKKLLNTSVYKDYFAHLFSHLREQIIENTDADGFTTMQPISWDYRYSNVCNFKCRMCGDMLSSAWEAEVRKHELANMDNPKNHWMLPHNRRAIRDFVQGTVVPEFEAAVENKTIREIYWVGGEPLLYDEHWRSMRRNVELGYADQVRVRYNTNLSVITDKNGSLYDLLNNFADWEICASLDGTGEIGEYIRTGLDYNNWLDNFKLGVASQKHSRQVRIDFTLTLPGLFDIGNIIELSKQFNVNLLSKVIFSFSPNIILSPLALPREILHPWLDQLIEECERRMDHNIGSLRDVLVQLKTRPTFQEQWPDEWKQGLWDGKRHLLKLESIRKGATLTMDKILEARPEVLAWWNSIKV